MILQPLVCWHVPTSQFFTPWLAANQLHLRKNMECIKLVGAQNQQVSRRRWKSQFVADLEWGHGPWLYQMAFYMAFICFRQVYYTLFGSCRQLWRWKGCKVIVASIMLHHVCYDSSPDWQRFTPCLSKREREMLGMKQFADICRPATVQNSESHDGPEAKCEYVFLWCLIHRSRSLSFFFAIQTLQKIIGTSWSGSHRTCRSQDELRRRELLQGIHIPRNIPYFSWGASWTIRLSHPHDSCW